MFRFLVLSYFFLATIVVAAPVDFAEDVKPLLNKHCVSCHGGVKKASGLSLLSFEQATGKAKSGLAAIVPNQPDESEMILRIRSQDEDERMPPPEHGSALTLTEQRILAQWINEGATWKKHWSFDAPQRNEARDSTSSIDSLIRASLAKSGMSPADQAPPAELLRRVTLDLTGLPPTPEELAAFANAPTTDAYQAVVERLLDSKHFGERWASLWMDVARYADSEGLGVDRSRKVWKYRDWLIEAFNEDKPYDKFIIEQLAGDLLPNPTMSQTLATAFHRLTQSNNEGGTDDEEFRVLAVMDRVSTTWEALQGVTFGCVQCHSHPYDDFQHEDYYSFMAFFNNTADADLGEGYPKLRVPLDKTHEAHAAKIISRRKLLNESIYEASSNLTAKTAWQNARITSAESSSGTGVEIVGDEFRATGNMAKGTTFTLNLDVPQGMTELTAFRIDLLPHDPENAKHTPEWGSVLSRITFEQRPPGSDSHSEIPLREVISDEPEPFYDPNESLKKGSRGAGPYSKQFHERHCVVVLEQPLKLVTNMNLRIHLKHEVFALGAFPLVTKRGRISLTNRTEWIDFSNNPSIALRRETLDSLSEAEKEFRAITIPILHERPSHLRRDTRVFERGNWLAKGKLVGPNVPASFPPLSADAPRDRLALAKWFVSSENPLTARVMANRLGEQLFGRGLVLTLEDFGSASDQPTHPRLLDHLAIRFQQDHGWSVKSLLKDIVLSGTYQQTASVSPAAYSDDPSNAKLGRGPRQRMTAEMVRDHALAVSGLFSPKLYGPPVYPPLPKGVWTPFSGEKWVTAQPNDSDRYRRSLYVFMKRSIPFPMFATFDAPSREICQQRRLPSNTPLQSLTLLNDEAFEECARALADRIDGNEGNLATKLAYGFLLTTSHPPRSGALNELERLYKRLRDTEKASHSEALTVVASVLINLDAALTK
ncbi:MAG: DUF1549 domain-containing protein [Verrucomicrobiaceae bacterium]|nr:DUF1549 domain-containing protein [Verrucomicrobiaceae bacterium]